MTVSASFCFWDIFIICDDVPAFRMMDALRSSGVSLSVVVIVMLALPAGPLLGFIVHQESARVFRISAVQSSDEENVISVDPLVHHSQIILLHLHSTH